MRVVASIIERNDLLRAVYELRATNLTTEALVMARADVQGRLAPEVETALAALMDQSTAAFNEGREQAFQPELN